MNLTEILAISGKPGLFKIEANRDNGIIASELGKDKKSFYPSRTHMFTPLENITIYTQVDSIELKEVFKKIEANEKDLIKANSSAKELRDFFDVIVPKHDKERVYTNDIKKIIKWYITLKEFGYLKEDKDDTSSKKVKSKSTQKVAKAKTTKKVAKPKAQNVKKVEKRGSQRGN